MPRILHSFAVRILFRSLAIAATLCGVGLLPSVAMAQVPAAEQAFATVLRIKGDVAAFRGESDGRRLRTGDRVFVGERLRAASAAEAVLKTDDAGMLAVRPGAEFVAENFTARGDAADGFTVRLIVGSLRIVTGWIGHTNRAGQRLATPTAIVGIRGTDHEPYVLDKDQAGAATTWLAGTYDKVNRGATVLEAAGQRLDVDAGKVGFARSLPWKDKALLTILLPVLLDKVPDFYVPGEFDAEVDDYSKTADETSRRELEQWRKKSEAECAPESIAGAWLAQLDAAIVRRDAAAVVALFAPDAAIRATVATRDGKAATMDFSRDELARSTLAALEQLDGYMHRRILLSARRIAGEGGQTCTRIGVDSTVIEQGTQGGKPFRFESREEYVLERRRGVWLASQAQTTQR